MGKSRHAVTLLAALLLAGCSSTGPITGSRYADLALRPNDARFVNTRETGDLRYHRYTLVEQFPNPTGVTAGMPSRIAFERLGKATGMTVGMSSIPPAETVVQSGRDVVIEWRTSAYWALARRVNDERVETLDVAVNFVRLTRTRDEIQFVGSPLFRDLDTGWFIEQVNVLPLLHNLKTDTQRR